jgi:hypothetical protein
MSKTTLAFLLGTGSSLAMFAAAPVSAQQAGAAQASSEPVIYLNQAWSQDDREWYYHFSQGSTVVSYDIFLSLETAGSHPAVMQASASMAIFMGDPPLMQGNCVCRGWTSIARKSLTSVWVEPGEVNLTRSGLPEVARRRRILIMDLGVVLTG